MILSYGLKKVVCLQRNRPTNSIVVKYVWKLVPFTCSDIEYNLINRTLVENCGIIERWMHRITVFVFVDKIHMYWVTALVALSAITYSTWKFNCIFIHSVKFVIVLDWKFRAGNIAIQRKQLDCLIAKNLQRNRIEYISTDQPSILLNQPKFSSSYTDIQLISVSHFG